MNHYFNPTVNMQTVEVGKNILDISNVTEIDNIFTVIIPIGKSTSSSKNSDGNLYIEGYREEIHGSGKYLKVPDIAKIYSDSELNSGYHKAEHYKNYKKDKLYLPDIASVSDNQGKTKHKIQKSDRI
jgi:hypothetical protein